MNPGVSDIADTSQWTALQRHAQQMSRHHLRELVDADPHRSERYITEVGDLIIDWSRHLVTDETMELLLALADQAGVAERISAMFAGQPINTTEGRPVLHIALRQAINGAETPTCGIGSTGDMGSAGGSVSGKGMGSGEAVMSGVGVGSAGGQSAAQGAAAVAAAELDRLVVMARSLRDGACTGATGKPIRTVVNIGIGGSHLGVVMACEALAAFRIENLDFRFVTNIDPADLVSACGGGLDPSETLFVVVSKSFTTTETLANARSARGWVEATLGVDAVSRHFVAVTAAAGAAVEFGVSPENVFHIWDWVGGRYSLGSAVAATLMTAIGDDCFSEMLRGMRIVDEHLMQQPPAANAPFVMGLLAVWYRNFMGLSTRAVLPYSQRLHLLPSYLQQLHMESNGKRVRLDGTPVNYDTGAIIWGAAGTGGQHSFHQFLHQGTTVVPADFIVFARPDPDIANATVNSADLAQQHDALVANCFAQAETLAFGTAQQDSTDPLAAHRELPGNRPSTVIMAHQLTPSVLGQLVALYEHEVLVQGAVWGINSFDQFGVEQGKTLADTIINGLRAEPKPTSADYDPITCHPSTASLLARYQRLRSYRS